MRSFAEQRVGELERRYRPDRGGRRAGRRASRRGARHGAHGRRLRGDGPPRGARRPGSGQPALPAALPGPARRRGVPRSCARPRPRRSRGCSASTSSGSPRSPTARTSAPRMCPPGRSPRPRRPPFAPASRTTTGRQSDIDDHGTTPSSRASAATSTAGPTPTPPAPTRAAASPRTSSATSRRGRASRSGCSSCGSRGCGCSTRKPMPTWGADLSGIDFDNIKYFVRSTEKQATSWDDLPGGHQEHLRPARHPRGREAAPRRRRRRPVRVRGRLPPDPRGPRGAGRHLPRHRHRPARARGAVQGVLRAR